VREVRECKKVKQVSERKSYMEVVGLLLKLTEDCFNSFSEPIAMIPRWLKEALVERMCIFQRGPGWFHRSVEEAPHSSEGHMRLS
jgi:hypothetical protein